MKILRRYIRRSKYQKLDFLARLQMEHEAQTIIAARIRAVELSMLNQARKPNPRRNGT